MWLVYILSLIIKVYSSLKVSSYISMELKVILERA